MEPASLHLAWYALLTLAFLLYAALDGFDLGIGVLTLFNRDPGFQKTAAASLAGVWHMNQTWLVVFGASLFGAFPMVYGVVLSALYVPIILLLAGLILRGIGLEFREESETGRGFYLMFGLGSLLASAAQGLGVGAWLSGLAVDQGVYTGGVFGFITPLSVILAAGLPFVYVLLGASRLMTKKSGPIADSCRNAALAAAWCALGAALLVVAWAVIAQPIWIKKWLAWPGVGVGLLPLAAGAALFFPLIKALMGRARRAPYLYATAATALLIIGLAGSVYPHVIPPAVDAAQAAADPRVLRVMLIGMAVFLPVIAVYSVYVYWVFRGEVQVEDYEGESRQKSPS